MKWIATRVVSSAALTVAAVLVVMVVVSACDAEDESAAELDQTWVATDPTSCLTNPWEQAWLADNPDGNGDYPHDLKSDGVDSDEFVIIRQFYADSEVEVTDVETRETFEVVCLACSCPEGHTMYLLVADEDVEIMKEFGYREEAPSP